MKNGKKTVKALPAGRQSLGGRKDKDAGDAKDAKDAKKRGRKSRDAELADSDDEDASTRKKLRKSNGASASAAKTKSKKQVEEYDSDDTLDPGRMTEYMTIPDWEPLVNIVDTVERSDDGDLYVYFSL